MLANKIKVLLPLINSESTGQRGAWIESKCPVAWNHGGEDKNPSFGISESTTKKSRCHCWSCGFSGDLMDLHMELSIGIKKHPELANKYDLGGSLQLIAKEMDELEFDPFIPSYEEVVKKKGEDEEVPEWWLESFKPVSMFEDAVEYLLNARKQSFQQELWEELDLRYSPVKRRICFPFRNLSGKLMGVQGRAIDKEAEKRYYFFNYKGSTNSQVWLGEDKLNLDEPVVLVEGPFDYMSIKRVYKNVAASFTSGLATSKVKRLGDAASIITFYDYGSGGNAARKKIRSVLKDRPIVDLIPSEEEDDPGDMSEDKLFDLLKDHISV